MKINSYWYYDRWWFHDKNLKQLVSYITGKDVRISYPNEHLGPESKDLVVSPMYSGVGLVLKFRIRRKLKSQ